MCMSCHALSSHTYIIGDTLYVPSSNSLGRLCHHDHVIISLSSSFVLSLTEIIDLPVFISVNLSPNLTGVLYPVHCLSAQETSICFPKSNDTAGRLNDSAKFAVFAVDSLFLFIRNLRVGKILFSAIGIVHDFALHGLHSAHRLVSAVSVGILVRL